MQNNTTQHSEAIVQKIHVSSPGSSDLESMLRWLPCVEKTGVHFLYLDPFRMTRLRG